MVQEEKQKEKKQKKSRKKNDYSSFIQKITYLRKTEGLKLIPRVILSAMQRSFQRYWAVLRQLLRLTARQLWIKQTPTRMQRPQPTAGALVSSG